MAKKIDEIDRHSQEVQDLLGKVPSWLIRNGMIMIVTMLIVLLIGSWLFKYPDFVSGPVVVSADLGKPSQLKALIKLDRTGLEKVSPGQKVNLKFENYPYLEFGIVRGVVGKVSSVPGGDSYETEIQLPDGLTTTFGKELEFRQELKGNAEIVTENISLLSRILDPVKAVFGKGKRK